MSTTDSLTRLREIAGILTRRRPAILTATTTLLVSVLEAADPSIAAERSPMAPATLMAEQVFEVARARGVLAFAGAAGDWLILLASLGLDLTDPGFAPRSSRCTGDTSSALSASATLQPPEPTSPLGSSPSISSIESAIVDDDMTFSRGGDLVISGRHPWRWIRGASVHATLEAALDVGLVGLVGYAQAVAT